MVRFARNAGTDPHFPTNVSAMRRTLSVSKNGVSRIATDPSSCAAAAPAAPPTRAGSTAKRNTQRASSSFSETNRERSVATHAFPPATLSSTLMSTLYPNSKRTDSRNT